MRPPVDHIFAPPFPAKLPWINSAALRMDQQRGRPVLVEFWDFCRPNSLRTLPYVQAWDERYREQGLRTIGVHASGFPPSAAPEAVEEAVARLGLSYPVIVDESFDVWKEYGNLGWPARYLFDGESRLFEFHYGEGGYTETEEAIQELLGIDAEPLAPLRPTDQPGADLALQSDDVAGPYSGPYEAGEVWAVLDGSGTVTANGHEIRVDHPGAYRLIAHDRSTSGELALEVGGGVECFAVCFVPGLA
ncbi:MAG TPA: redoxin domain-containing protein [Solirubrobacteraceae bacterium]